MNGRYLLDTNAVIALMNKEPALMGHLQQAAEVFVPIVVVGELAYGAYQSARQGENLARLNQFVQASQIVGCDQGAALRYGAIKAELRKKGRMIPENDIWIAAIAREANLTLVSRDGHFREVEGLRLETWQ